MISFETFFLESLNIYRPKSNDVFYHGSPIDFDPRAISKGVKGLVYVTRNIEHTIDYAIQNDDSKGFILFFCFW